MVFGRFEEFFDALHLATEINTLGCFFDEVDVLQQELRNQHVLVGYGTDNSNFLVSGFENDKSAPDRVEGKVIVLRVFCCHWLIERRDGLIESARCLRHRSARDTFLTRWTKYEALLFAFLLNLIV